MLALPSRSQERLLSLQPHVVFLVSRETHDSTWMSQTSNMSLRLPTALASPSRYTPPLQSSTHAQSHSQIQCPADSLA